MERDNVLRADVPAVEEEAEIVFTVILFSDEMDFAALNVKILLHLKMSYGASLVSY
jgi:hypothetical protein